MTASPGAAGEGIEIRTYGAAFAEGVDWDAFIFLLEVCFMKLLDFRSDTVTHPTPAMREAMYRAEVGDDVYQDDPTTNRLETLAAETLGMEAALFVPSGTMGNQLALMSHTYRGEEAIVSVNSHIFEHEVGAAAVLSGLNLRPHDLP